MLKKILLGALVVVSSIGGYVWYDKQMLSGDCIAYSLGSGTIIHKLVFEVVNKNDNGVVIKFHQSMNNLMVTSDEFIDIQIFLGMETTRVLNTMRLITNDNLYKYSEIKCPNISEGK